MAKFEFKSNPDNEFHFFLGIDQTGATDQKGQPKNLNCCLIDSSSQEMKVFTGLVLKNLSVLDIINLIQTKVKNFKKQRVLICVDTVFGLPETLKTSYQQIFQHSKEYEFKSKKYGALTAFTFFNSFLNDEEKPKRKIEKLTKANSVFNLTPFQKNIGCGSYRVIKQLSLDTSWFSLWPFEKADKQFVIAEGYPSYIWKNLLLIKSRNLNELKIKFPSLDFKTIDQADSFLLSYGALKYQNQITKRPAAIAKTEGWILGVPFE